MKSYATIAGAACLALGIVVGAAQAATLTASGATNVEVDGAFYDVSFVDGTCIALFDGCDDPSDFEFNTPSAAILASQALLQLFNAPGNEMFSSQPATSDGCGDANLCYFLTPYAISAVTDNVFTSYFQNLIPSPLNDSISVLSFSRVSDTSSDTAYVYANWAPVAPVPLPAGGVLLLGALGGLAVLRRRKKHVS